MPFANRLTCPLKSLILLLTLPGLAQAQSYVWPDSSGPCATTLQACLNNVPSASIVTIIADGELSPAQVGAATSTFVNLTQSVHLRSGSAHHPVLPSGTGFGGTFTTPVEVRIEGIGLRNRGVQLIAQHASGTSHFVVQDMEILIDSAGTGQILIENNAEGNTEIDVRGNRYFKSGGIAAPVRVRSSAGQVGGLLRENDIRVAGSNTSVTGIQASAADTGTLNLSINNNRVHASFSTGAIVVTTSPTVLTDWAGSVRVQGNVLISRNHHTGTGIRVIGGERGFHVQINNNTVIGHHGAITVSNRWWSDPPDNPEPLSGLLANNLLTQNLTALSISEPGQNLTNHANLFWDNNSNTGGTTPPTLAGNSIMSDPVLLSRNHPIPQAGSAAIDTAVSGAVSTWLPATDAAGHRRIKGSGLDIGAYEFGGDWFRSRSDSGNTSFNVYYLNHPALNGINDTRVLATPHRHAGTTSNYHPFGVWYSTSESQWSLFNQNLATMPLGAVYNHFVPASGFGNFLHVHSGSIEPETVLTNAAVAGQNDAVIVVTQNWNPAGAAGVYNNSRIAIAGGGVSGWRIVNTSGNSMPNNAAFNVFSRPAGPAALVHTADIHNTEGSVTIINHYGLNSTPCPILQVTPRAGDFGDRDFEVEFRRDLQRWAIRSPSNIPLGSQFNIVFDGQRASQCRGDRIFADRLSGAP
jgi:hypothetical protein